MNIQQQNNKSNRRQRIVRSAFAAGAAVAAAVAIGSMTSATAANPVEQSAPHPVIGTVGAVTAPCHIQPTWNRISNDVGPTPRCTHAYGSVNAFGIENVDHRNGTGPAVRHSFENISVYDAETPGPTDKPDAGSGEGDHWRACFYNARSFHAWEQVQVGMPRCDIQAGHTNST